MAPNQDLFVLAADTSMETVIEKGLQRNESLGIRQVTVHATTHAGRDGGARTTGVSLMATQASLFEHGLLVFDHEGSGAREAALDLEARLDEELARAWGDRAKAIVIDPEVDIWLWGSNNALAQVLNWSNPNSIRDWLLSEGFAFDTANKPIRPKEAIEAVLRECRIVRSAAIYGKIVERISLARCTDQAFRRLSEALAGWFRQGDAAR